MQPTVVPYSHLYDVDECSKFIADFIYYSPERYPPDPSCIICNVMCPRLRVYNGTVNSPSSVIVQQSANSLEMSILLVSLLRSERG